MNALEFVKAIKSNVRDAAVEDTIARLRSPSGRKVSRDVQERSDWYNRLPPSDQAFVNSVIAGAVQEAVFGLFAVLDGARTVDDENGRFELVHVASQRTILNDPRGEALHDLLQD